MLLNKTNLMSLLLARNFVLGKSTGTMFKLHFGLHLIIIQFCN
jgi:hypothetical protein